MPFGNSFKRFLHKYFYFSKAERNGFVVLLIFYAIIFAFVFFSKSNQNFSLPSDIEKKVDSFYLSLKKKDNYQALSRLDKYILAKYDTLKLFKFNPNTASDDDFRRLGLTEKQIKNIRKYQQNGGKFYVKEDFKRIYSIRSRQYLILEPYIDLPSEKKIEKQYFVFDPNTVSYQELLKLGFSKSAASKIIKSREKGWKFYTKEDFKKHYAVSDEIYKKLEPYIKINVSKILPEINSAKYYDILFVVKNKTLASRIINFRDKLGGFYSLEQLKEVYGMQDSIYKRIVNILTINPNNIKKIDINHFSEKQLSKHPYINRKQAALIVKERENKPFVSLEDLKMRKIFDDYSLKRLEAYLEFK